MKHDWHKWTDSKHWLEPTARACLNCGARQHRACIAYDRMTGSRYAWRPLVGKCRAKSAIPAKLNKNKSVDSAPQNP